VVIGNRHLGVVVEESVEKLLASKEKLLSEQGLCNSKGERQGTLIERRQDFVLQSTESTRSQSLKAETRLSDRR
jgi:hypothetical protein